MPADSGLSFILVMHLAPHRESNIAEILQSATSLTVAQVNEAQPLVPNHVYAIAPNTVLSLDDGMLQPLPPEEDRHERKPVDTLFASLVDAKGDRAIGIILSGAGSDGTEGAKRLRDAGGLCIAQEPETAGYASMPHAAIDAGVVDAVLPPEEIPQALVDYVRSGKRLPTTRPAKAAELPQGFDGILALLGKTYGLDFREYKTGTLRRRTERRMGLKGVSNPQDYLQLLQEEPAELAALYSDLLIGVTKFFRDPESWAYLGRHVIADLLAGHDEDHPVRLWVAGGASGEEAYGLAMLFLEQIERLGRPIRLQIYTTDVSPDAAAAARRGLYPASIEKDVSAGRLRRFFQRRGDYFQVTERVRESMNVAVHNLLTDPPFSRMDLVSCRNVLIYLEPQAQAKVLESLHFALREGGVLWLGSSETVGAYPDLFTPLSEVHRFYRPVETARPSTRHRMPQWIAQKTPIPAWPQPRPVGAAPVKGPTLARQVEQFVLQRHTEASVAVDENLEILYFFGPTDRYLAPPAGEARLDLLSWARPGLYTKLRAALIEAINNEETVNLRGVHIERDGQRCRVACAIEPIPAAATSRSVFLVTFRDEPEPQPPAVVEDGERGDPALVRQLEAELKDARQEQKETLLQLEAANEQYGASHEELISLNEELQSSNEELETSKEELQSLNEELVTINHQLEEKNKQLRSVNADLNNLLGSTGVPTLFLDRHLNIRRFTPEATTIMRLQPTDVGRSIGDIRSYVEDGDVIEEANEVLETLHTKETEVRANDGRWFIRRVMPYRTDEDRIDGICLTFQEVTAQKQAASESERARRFSEAIVRATRTPLLVLNGHLTVVAANPAFYEKFAATQQDTRGQNIFDVGKRQWDIPQLRRLLEEVLPEQAEVRDFEIEHAFEELGWRILRVDAHTLTGLEPSEELILVSIEDDTELLRARHLAEQRADALADEHQRKDQFLAMLGHELRNPVNTIAHAVELQGVPQNDPARIEELRAMMRRQVRRITTLLNQLLELSRVISGKIEVAQEPVDLADVVGEAVESQLTLLREKRQELTQSLPQRGRAVVRGDATRLVQVTENLLGNAIKYTPAGGHIWLTVEPEPDAVQLRVRDNGMGIEPELLPHIFGVFTQAPTELVRATGGLGLGLPLVRHLVEMHGGEVWASSPGPDGGSEFVVRLPRLPGDALQSASESLGRSEPRQDRKPAEEHRPRRVLVVEDEPDAATALVALLEALGYQPRAARDGTEALALAASFEPDVVLLDLGLPGMNGYEVAARIRERCAKQPVLIALTGYQPERSRLEAAGFDDHLLKPPELEALQAALRP